MVAVKLKPIDDDFQQRKENFTAQCTGTGIEERGEKKNKYVMIGFADDPELPLSIPIKGLKEDGESVGTFYGLGTLVKSLQKHGYAAFMDIDAMEFYTEPSLIGKTVTVNVTSKEQKKDETVRTYYSYAIEKIDGGATGTTAPSGQQTSAPQGQGNPGFADELITLITENLTAPMNEAAIMTKVINAKVTDPAHRKALNDIRKSTLTQMVKDELLDLKEGKYSVKA